MSRDDNKQRTPMTPAPERKRSGRGEHGGPPGMMPVEKAKDFKGTMKKLVTTLSRYRIGFLFMMIFAIGSTIFSIIGPTIMGDATTEIFNGLFNKLGGGEGIQFDKVTSILITLITLYVVSALFSFIQGWIMNGIAQKVTYKFRKDISEKNIGYR
jgi:ATP-binding cassette subfamily B protein